MLCGGVLTVYVLLFCGYYDNNITPVLIQPLWSGDPCQQWGLGSQKTISFDTLSNNAMSMLIIRIESKKSEVVLKQAQKTILFS